MVHDDFLPRGVVVDELAESARKLQETIELFALRICYNVFVSL